MQLRDYQQCCFEAVLSAFEKEPRTLVVMATGSGKTIIFAHLVKHYLERGRVMVLADREELIFQASEKIEAITGIKPDLEMADWRANEHGMFKSPIIVSTIQTQIAGKFGARMNRFNPHEFSLLILDEAHGAVCESWQRCIDYYTNGNGCKVLGVTATPDRADSVGLWNIFGKIAAFRYEALQAIADGWLVPVKQLFVPCKCVSLRKVAKSGDDLNIRQTSAQLEQIEAISVVAKAATENCAERRTLVYTTGVEQARLTAAAINAVKDKSARWLVGKTPKDERRDIIQGFRDGSYQYLVNCAVACLDDQTEILTSEGWVGCDRISSDYEIACWNHGRIHFAKPIGIEVRERRRDERMVVLETERRSIRVTDNHRMLYRTWPIGNFRVKKAWELVDKKCQLPICGIAEPFFCHVETPSRTHSKARLSANTYLLRYGGMDAIAAKQEAIRRIEHRDSLRYKQPSDLSDDECRWIGFWVGDGCRARLASGGVTYRVCGSDSWPTIAAWFESLSVRCGFDFVKRTIPPSRIGGKPLTQWSFSRGTGFGPQKRRGLFPIEPYLRKEGSPLWWTFSGKQFDAFLDGLWCADGNHRQGTERPKSARIYGSNRNLLDLLQAIAVCRSYRANIQWKANHDHVIGCLSLSKRESHACTKFTLQFEPGWRSEIVWCVKSETGFIVTRRRGTVTITGNTQGFDVPECEVIVDASPTLSRLRYAQRLGRAMRPLTGLVDPLPTKEERRAAISASAKPNMLVLDFVMDAGRHKLITASDVLAGRRLDRVIHKALKKAEKSGREIDVEENLDQAQREYDDNLKYEKGNVVAEVEYELIEISPFDTLHGHAPAPGSRDRGVQATPAQIALLRKFRIDDPHKLTKAAASATIGECIRRSNGGLCTYKQAKLLKRYGHETKDMSFAEARRLLDALAENGWRRESNEIK